MNDDSALFWGYLPLLYDSDYALILCPLCKLHTLWNILKILGRNVEQDKTMCRIQAWQLWLSYYCTHGRSHTRSPGVSVVRVDSRELPLSAIPFCQLLPCHLEPSRPMRSLNLYMKGCLYCITGVFHMSIPAEPSVFQIEVQILNAKPRK